MKLSFAAAAAATLSMLGAVNANCDKGPFVSTNAGVPVDKNAANLRFCDSRWEEGIIITGIKVWSAKFHIKAVRFQYAGGDWGPIHGEIPKNNVNEKEKTWNENDKIDIKVWNNKPDDGDPMDAVGRIQIIQEGKPLFEAGADGKKIQKNEVFVDNPSGKLLAVKGASHQFVASLEFKFLSSPIKSVTLTDMKFKEDVKRWNDKKQGQQPAVLGSVYFLNSSPVGSENATYDNTVQISKTVSKTITTQQTHTGGYELSIKVGGKVGVPLLTEGSVEVTNAFSYQYAHMKSDALTDTDTWGFTWRMGGTASGIAPRRAAHCKATAVMGTFDSEYEGTVTALLANGKTFTYKNVGQYKSVGYADGKQDCKVIPIEEVPKDAEKQEAKKSKGKRSSRLARFVHAA